MNRDRTAGVALAALGALGYVIGVLVAYPGRAFSITGIMIGATVIATSGGEE